MVADEIRVSTPFPLGRTLGIVLVLNHWVIEREWYCVSVRRDGGEKWVAYAGWVSSEMRSKSQETEASCYDDRWFVAIRAQFGSLRPHHTIVDVIHRHRELQRLLSWQSAPWQSGRRRLIVEGGD
jgi:hypothetical protein